MKTTLIFLLIVCFFITEEAIGRTPRWLKNMILSIDCNASQKINLASKDIFIEGCFFTDDIQTHAIDDFIKVLVIGLGYSGKYNKDDFSGRFCFYSGINEIDLLGFNRILFTLFDFNWYGTFIHDKIWFEVGIGKSILLSGKQDNDHIKIKTMMRMGLRTLELGSDFQKTGETEHENMTLPISGLDLSLQYRTSKFVIEPYVKLDYLIAKYIIARTGVDLLFSSDIYKLSSPAYGLKYEYTNVSSEDIALIFKNNIVNHKLTLFYRYNIPF